MSIILHIIDALVELQQLSIPNSNPWDALVPRYPLTRLKRSLSSASVHVRGLGANNLIPHLAIGSMSGRFTYIYHTKSTNFRYIYIHIPYMDPMGFGLWGTDFFV